MAKPVLTPALAALSSPVLKLSTTCQSHRSLMEKKFKNLISGLHYPTRLAMTSHFSHQHKQLKFPKEIGSELFPAEMLEVKKEKTKVKRERTRVKKVKTKKNENQEISNKENQVNYKAHFIQ